MTFKPRFRYTLASSAYWFAGVSIGLGLIRLGTSRGLPAIFNLCTLSGSFLLGACLGMVVGLYTTGAAGARSGAIAGGCIVAMLGLVWIMLQSS